MVYKLINVELINVLICVFFLLLILRIAKETGFIDLSFRFIKVVIY